MKMRIKMLKIIYLFIIFIYIFSMFSFCKAYTTSNYSGSTRSEFDGVSKLMKALVAAIQAAGTGIAAMMLFIIGAKYVMGSADGKAEIKQYAVPFTIGALVFFGATGIVSMLKTMAG